MEGQIPNCSKQKAVWKQMALNSLKLNFMKSAGVGDAHSLPSIMAME